MRLFARNYKVLSAVSIFVAPVGSKNSLAWLRFPRFPFIFQIPLRVFRLIFISLTVFDNFYSLFHNRFIFKMSESTSNENGAGSTKGRQFRMASGSSSVSISVPEKGQEKGQHIQVAVRVR